MEEDRKILLESQAVPIKLIARIVECEGCKLGPCAQLWGILEDGSEVLMAQLNTAGDIAIGDPVKVQLSAGLMLVMMGKQDDVGEATKCEHPSYHDIMMKAYGLEDEQ